jgi:phosphoribosylamine-glycine ligase
MGSYSCENHSLPFLSREDVDQAKHINEAVAQALFAETGRPYRGVLYGGFMATAQGVRVIEYNARFGDPECMNVLPILEGDFLAICDTAAAGELDSVPFSFSSHATVCKYVVPRGYPDEPPSDGAIAIPSELFENPQLQVFYAAVEQCNGEIRLSGSRAVAILGIGDTLREAEAVAEHGASAIGGATRHRKDIGTQRLVAARVGHMQDLRRRARVVRDLVGT